MKSERTPIGWSVCMSDNSFLDNLSDIPERLNSRNFVRGGILYCPAFAGFYNNVFAIKTVSYTHLTLPTNREV